MNKNDLFPVILEREAEKLRQERETFEQRKEQENRWFKLRLIMGYSAVVLLTVIMVVSSFIVLNYKYFPGSVTTSASIAFFGDVLGLLICVWKIVLNPNFMTKLEPATSTVRTYDEFLKETHSGFGNQINTSQNFSVHTLEIIQATYGLGNSIIDITEKIRTMIINNKINILANNQLAGKDPYPGRAKKLHIRYRYNNKENDAVFTEGQNIIIP